MNSKALLASLALVGSAVCGPAFAQANSEIVYSLLYSWPSGPTTQTPSNGIKPYFTLGLGSDGAFYGDTLYGGTFAEGSLFRLDPNTGVVETLFNFGPLPAAAYPLDTNGLVEDSQGNWYGTTLNGGTFTHCTNGCGTVFEYSAGSITVLHNFGATNDGFYPFSGLTIDDNGNLFGVTHQGGANGDGTVFTLTNQGGGSFTYTKMHDFNGSDGEDPYNSNLVWGPNGLLYGTTFSGGTKGGEGTVFSIMPTAPYTLTTLHSFDGTDGQDPSSTLLVGQDSNLYGTTFVGGSHGDGTIFGLSPSGATFVSLHSFDPSSDGAAPYAGLVQDASGNFFGNTFEGGAEGYGTIFMFSLSGKFKVLHNFDSTSGDALGGCGSLLQPSTDIFVGVSCNGGSSNQGAIYQIDVSQYISSMNGGSTRRFYGWLHGRFYWRLHGRFDGWWHHRRPRLLHDE